jgi:hypothetical protein
MDEQKNDGHYQPDDRQSESETSEDLLHALGTTINQGTQMQGTGIGKAARSFQLLASSF